MIQRTTLIQSISEYLGISEFDDYCVNGIQVEGSEKVSRIITGVSASGALFEAAVEDHAQLIIVHHGLFWKSFSSPVAITGLMRARLKILLAHDITLAAYHLPLDAHSEIGNNAQILLKLGFPVHDRFDVGFLSHLPKPVKPYDLKARMDNLLPDACSIFGETDEPISVVAVVSGDASHLAEKARAAGADALITGDVSEPSVRIAEELGLCLVRTGHYNSERFGPMALTAYLADRFGLSVNFVDIPNMI
ncbi:Nif3-like dinuclear metal center hexameric protein [bacterium]|nr:Nif3-like dinuclear metal center hexameric protein [candidate division CSSED10-310 bacterium]